MDVSDIIFSTLSCVIGRLFAKVMPSTLRSVAGRLLASKVGLGMICAFAYCLPKLSESTNIFLFSMLSASIVGLAMGLLFAKILQNCVRMDVCSTVASTIEFSMICLLTKILHNYVIRMSEGRIIGNAVGYVIAEILQKLFERLYQEYKKYQPNRVTLRVQDSTVRFLRVQANYVRSLGLQARLQASIHAQLMDAHQDQELHELWLEADELCHDLHKECHEQLQKMCHDLHKLCQSYRLCDCTNPCTNLCSTLGSRLDEGEVANDPGGNSDGLPGVQEETAVH